MASANVLGTLLMADLIGWTTLLRVLGDEAYSPPPPASSIIDRAAEMHGAARSNWSVTRTGVLRPTERRSEGCLAAGGGRRVLDLRRAPLCPEMRNPLGPPRFGAAWTAWIRGAVRNPVVRDRDPWQILVSHAAEALLEGEAPEFQLEDLERTLPGRDRPDRVFGLSYLTAASTLVSEVWSAGRHSTATGRSWTGTAGFAASSGGSSARRPAGFCIGITNFDPSSRQMEQLTYREVLTRALEALAEQEGVELDDPAALADSLPSWQPFPEARGSLEEARARGWRLAILSNTDPDIAASKELIGVPFDETVVASEIGSHKPAHGHWEEFFRRTRADRERHVHVAASLFHDIAPETGSGCGASGSTGSTRRLVLSPTASCAIWTGSPTPSTNGARVVSARPRSTTSRASRDSSTVEARSSPGSPTRARATSVAS